MKKFLMIAVLAMTLTGCDFSSKELTSNYSLPNGLEDCHLYRVTPDSMGKTLYVVRCPKSSTSTTYSSGKNDSTSVSYNEE